MHLRLPKFREDDAYQFRPLLSEIEEDPGSPLGPWTFWLVVAIFAFFLMWTIFGQVDIVVSATGKVVPAGQIKLVQPLSGGVISGILVKEGDYVKKGQPLVIIDPSTTLPDMESSKENLAHLQMEQNRLLASSGNGTLSKAGDSEDAATQAQLYRVSQGSVQAELAAKSSNIEDLDAQIRGKQAQIGHAQDSLKISLDKRKRLETVKDIIAKDDYDKNENDIINEEGSIRVLTHDIDGLTDQKQQARHEMAYIKQNYESTILSDLSDKQKQIVQLKAQLAESEFKNARQTLVSPVDGYVHEMFVHTVGGVVTSAQKILSIVPVNTPLLIEATVLNRDIGFVKQDMPVTIKIDTFDFQKYGTLKGTVAQVDKDSHDDQKLGPVYTIYVRPDQHALYVDGKWQEISAGLSVQAEIKTGNRRIIEFFIYPLIKHLNEGMSVR